MSVPLLTTKLYAPPLRSGRVPRLRLVARLQAGLELKLTLVSAPAGFGKTTLLAECIAGCHLPAAWLSLDAADNDPVRFWTYLLAALRSIPALQQAGVGQAAASMLAPIGLAGLAGSTPPSEALLGGLINDLAAAAVPCALVLDDLHLIADAGIHAGLVFLVEHMPPPPHGLRLVVATRADPPWPLARLRARGQVAELRAADLRFTPEETTAFLNGVMGLDLPNATVAALDSRTEGWIAGLQLAALSIQGHLQGDEPGDVASFIEAFTGSHRFVLDYLVEEVLDQQSPAVQRFLLETSMLERMCAPLCDAVLGSEPETQAAAAAGGRDRAPAEGGEHSSQVPSQQLLEQLDAANLFIVSLDEERRWYRYHHLFADLLLQRLKQGQGGRLSLLHLRASAWFERHGLIPEAVSHALAADDVERVADLVEAHTVLAIFHGGLATVLGWLSAVPEGVMRRRPWLSIGRAWALASAGQWDEAERLLSAAEALIMQEPDVNEAQARRLMGHIVVLRAYGAGIKGELPRARELAMLGLELVPRGDVTVYNFCANLLGATLRYSGELAAAAQVWTEALAASRAAGDLNTELPLLNALASLQLEMGRLRAVESTSHEAFRRAGQAVDGGVQPLLLLAPIHARLSALRREWNDPQAALRHAREGVRLSEAWGHAEAVVTAHGRLAFALQAVGEPQAALEAMQLARQGATQLSTWYHDLTAAEQADLWLLQGNLEAAVGWSRESGLHATDEMRFDRVTAYIVLARVLIADGRPGEALPLLARLLGQIEAAGAMGWAIKILVLQALALHAQGQSAAATPVLARALFLAEPEGYVTTFLSAGADMSVLLSAVGAWLDQAGPGRRYRHLGAYVRRLVAACPAPGAPDTGRPATAHRPSAAAALVEPLSERELEVLRLLDTHLSTRDIADHLVVAVSTVRTHVKSIYGKLDAHGRIEAVHRARELGLL